MRRTYQIFGWGLVLLGGLHMYTTFRAFDTLSSPAVWFFGAGIAMSLTGALNLLNASYGHAARGLRLASIAINVAMIGYATVAGLASEATPVEFAVIVGWVAGTAALSLSPATARGSRGEPS